MAGRYKEKNSYFSMDINIKKLLEGAKESEGTTVIIDIFRASNTIIACLAGGAEYIIPIGDLGEAYELRKKNPDHLLFGERKGLPPEGFDYGNSPAQAARLDLKGRKIILTTSAGSQGIVNAKKADEILIGSFVNSGAIVSYILNKNPQKVSLVAIGSEASEPALEDERCAEYIESRLSGEKVNFDQMANEILQSNGANWLRKMNQNDDLEFALRLDIYGVIPRLDRQTNRLVDCSLGKEQK